MSCALGEIALSKETSKLPEVFEKKEQQITDQWVEQQQDTGLGFATNSVCSAEKNGCFREKTKDAVSLGE